MPSSWSECLEEGERLHAYLLTHYDELMGDERMEHFDIYYTSYATACEYEYISKRYGSYVKEAIRPWIEEEYKSGRLFERDNWKPFRDAYNYTPMYYGYRPLFIFHDILYFQLTLCDRVVDTPEGGLARYIVFEAALYGWNVEGISVKQSAGCGVALIPDGQVLLDNRMLERDWKIQ